MGNGRQNSFFVLLTISFSFTFTFVDTMNCSDKSVLNGLEWVVPERRNNFVDLLVGEWKKIDCSVKTCNMHFNATLLQQSPPVDGHQYPKMEIKLDNQHIVIVKQNVFNISKLRLSDGGKYYCKISSLEKFASRISINGDFEPFAKPNVTRTPDMLIYPRGQVITLNCSVAGPFYLTWRQTDDTNVKRFTKVIPFKTRNGNGKMFKVTATENVTYLCQVQRFAVEYVYKERVLINVEGTIPPSFAIFQHSSVITAIENSIISFTYKVLGNPSPFISWLKEKDETIEMITHCHLKKCETPSRKNVFITTNTFRITNIQYPKDNNVVYKCTISNLFGNDTKQFLLRVHTRPYIVPVTARHIYQKGMRINCTVWKSNPNLVNFTWYSCNPRLQKCNSSDSKLWKNIQKETRFNETKILQSVLVLKQTEKRMLYRCTAQNSVGRDEIKLEVFNIQGTSRDQEPNKNNFAIDTISILVAIIVSVGAFVIFFVLFNRWRLYGGFYLFSYPPLLDYIEKLDLSKDVQEQMRKMPYIPEWEFPREKISLDSELGKGEFGCVWLATATGVNEFHPRDMLRQRSNKSRLSVVFQSLRYRSTRFENCVDTTTIAVKMLKDNWETSQMTDLLSELKLLIHVGNHEHIVNLLGACTKGPSGNLWLLLEYCSFGDLRKFLLDKRDVYNHDELSFTSNHSCQLGPNDLILFALQIASGMEFLASRKIVHRDIAARNILLGNGYVAKVADFGLARDVYKSDAYIKNSTTSVPLKWLAIESIQYSLYTEKSDVWSFGVLLWEIFTLGETPYRGVQAVDVFKLLLKGKRLQSPIHCPCKISQVMKSCWVFDAEDRPSFKTLVKDLKQCSTNTENSEMPLNDRNKDVNKDEIYHNQLCFAAPSDGVVKQQIDI